MSPIYIDGDYNINRSGRIGNGTLSLAWTIRTEARIFGQSDGIGSTSFSPSYSSTNINNIDYTGGNIGIELSVNDQYTDMVLNTPQLSYTTTMSLDLYYGDVASSAYVKDYAVKKAVKFNPTCDSILDGFILFPQLFAVPTISLFKDIGNAYTISGVLTYRGDAPIHYDIGDTLGPPAGQLRGWLPDPEPFYITADGEQPALYGAGTLDYQPDMLAIGDRYGIRAIRGRDVEGFIKKLAVMIDNADPSWGISYTGDPNNPMGDQGDQNDNFHIAFWEKTFTGNTGGFVSDLSANIEIPDFMEYVINWANTGSATVIPDGGLSIEAPVDLYGVIAQQSNYGYSHYSSTGTAPYEIGAGNTGYFINSEPLYDTTGNPITYCSSNPGQSFIYEYLTPWPTSWQG